jgi:hypothetical protein
MLAMMILAMLTACAGGGPVDPVREPGIEQIAEAIGCTSEEVAVCIEVNCDVEDYQCAARDDVRRMFKAGEFRHR